MIQNIYGAQLDTIYHVTYYQTQDHLTITMNGIKKVDIPTPSHPILFNQNIYLSKLSQASADVTVSNLFISASNSHSPNAFNYLCDADNRLSVTNGTWRFNTNECNVQITNESTVDWNSVWLAAYDAYSLDWTDYTVQVSFAINAGLDILILFRSQSLSSVDDRDGYWMNVGFGANHIKFGKSTPSTHETIAQTSFSWEYDTIYTMRIQIIGSQFNIYHDDQFLFSATDTAYESGSVGMAGWMSSATFHSLRIVFESDNDLLYTSNPTSDPTSDPTIHPTEPSIAPSQPTIHPSTAPSFSPTNSPSQSPSAAPSLFPSLNPSNAPSGDPSNAPSMTPTHNPSIPPSNAPSLSPTDSPSQSPSATPSLNPSVNPSNPPSGYPSNAPSMTPTHNPSVPPSVAPTSAPSKSPTNNPSVPPSAAPSTAPSTQPTPKPTFNPTIYPTLGPLRTFHPTTDPMTNHPSSPPTKYPSSNPTVHPTSHPTVNPTSNPTVNPTSDPTIDPTSNPTVNPTSDPTLDPTLNPTVEPTSDPTVNPTSDPTVNPTSAPTKICHNAKYKDSMSSARNERNDFLWGGESLVSDDCRFLLRMNTNGDLVIYETGHWSIGWRTNTLIYNRSGESVPRLILQAGAIKIMEYLYRNVPSLKPIELWHSEASKDGGNMDGGNMDELTLTLRGSVLSDTVCLMLNRYGSNNGARVDPSGALWFVCCTFPIDGEVDDGRTATDYVSSVSSTQVFAYETNWGKYKKEKDNRGITLSVVFGVILLGCLVWFILKKRSERNNNEFKAANSASDMPRMQSFASFDDVEGDAVDQETQKQIDNWLFETATGENTDSKKKRKSLEVEMMSDRDPHSDS